MNLKLIMALVSDAGTPLVSDPGGRLVQAVWERGHTVVPIPGASANGASNYAPRYSPDGKWIVFNKADWSSLVAPTSDLWLPGFSENTLSGVVVNAFGHEWIVAGNRVGGREGAEQEV